MTKNNKKRFYPGLTDRLRGLRKTSRQVAATRAETTLPTFADAENHGLATPETLRKIARVLGVSVDELTGRKSGGQ